MRGVLQEKNSRIIEIILSSANPFQIMIGKIIGIGGAGLTQYFIWSVSAMAIIFYSQNMAGVSNQWFNFSLILFLYFII